MSGSSPLQRPRRWRRALLWTALLFVLVAVFLAYTQPALMMQLSEQLWACF
jgi:type II secretory pathway component PulM